MPMQGRRTLYPEIQPYQTGMLDVGDGHSLYWELSGNSNGKPVVFLHGGPGGGSSPDHRRQFNPDKYKILVFDQRGCGKSTPYASLEHNTTWDLVEDIEKLRVEVAKVDKWQVFGGSWGSTLALTYAEEHAERVTELVLRGIFLFDQFEIDWMYKEGGASQVYPDKFEEFVGLIPEGERGDLVEAYRKRLTSGDKEEQLCAAKAWSKWEGDIVTLLPSPETIEHFTSPEVALAVSRIENHYMANHGWLEEGQLLEGARKLKGIPGVIVQGRHDTCTPPVAAWRLKQAWPEVELNLIPDAGHLFSEPGNLDALVRATDKFEEFVGLIPEGERGDL
ncbi:MAG TPA: prolyl aminopeptidase, partial [Sphingomicrobium sp.]|nr:prolyl aminopeptidase [Sphingomicrobium sp.]